MSESGLKGVDTANRVLIDDDDFKHGDLGLGNGLKPGSLSAGDAHVGLDNKPTIKLHRNPSLALSRTESYSSLSSENSDSDELSVGDDEQKPSKLSQFFSRKNEEQEDIDESFPTYADIPYGTTIKQQKRLFHHDLEKIISKNMPCEEVCTDEDCTLCGSRSPAPHFHKATLAADIEHRLYKAQCEIDELQIELENCSSRLQAKYHAIDILRKQAEFCERECEEVEQRASAYSHKLEKPLELEINSLQFSLQHQESMLETSQEVWTERFDRFLRDNAMLTSKLKSRTEELNLVSRENIGLKRERDELLALIDLQDKSKYERSHSTSSNDLYNNYTSSELAVLGACSCRSTKPDPCGCAHAAVKLQREIFDLLDQLNKEKQQQKEGEQTVEAYRVAFEEQLRRNKKLTRKVAEVGAPMNQRIDKTKHIIKWVMQSMYDDDASLGAGYNLNGLLIADIDTTKFTDRQLLLILIDMMNERSELRAHQKLALSIVKKSLPEDVPEEAGE